MAKTTNDQATKQEFAKRLNEELDRVGIDRRGRAAMLARAMAVSHTSATGWLKGQVPALKTLRDLCDHYGLDFLYVCTGRRQASPGIDLDLYGAAMKQVNGQVKKMKLGGKVSTEQLAWLYVRVYQAMLSDTLDVGALESDIRLAAS